MEDFKSDITREYSITIDSDCDYLNKLLSIDIVLSIPDIHKPINMDLEQIINHLTYKFTKFYEREIQVFKNEKGEQ